MKVYYNEIEPRMVAWLKELIIARLIPDGDIDDRSIYEVEPTELLGYQQLHFFAGLGGWALALRLAGWPDWRRVITGSCPCQPFSCAGQGMAHLDERHLFPRFCRLIAELHDLDGFSEVIGEQVASKAGRLWLGGVRASLEGMGFAVGGADLCAAGVRAPHIRQRLWWFGKRVAESKSREFQRSVDSWGWWRRPSNGRAGCWVAYANGSCGSGSGTSGLGHTVQPGLEGHSRNGHNGHEPGRERAGETGPATEAGAFGRLDEPGLRGRGEGQGIEGNGGIIESGAGFWDHSIWWLCRDGKRRRVPAKFALQSVVDGLSESVARSRLQIDFELFPLAPSEKGRVALLRGAGNAIVPQLAAEFIMASTEALDELAKGA